MSRVSPCIKRAVWLLVIYGMLCVLISPLQIHSAFSGKSLIGLFCLVTFAVLDHFFSLLVSSGFSRPGFASSVDVLDKICIRLC